MIRVSDENKPSCNSDCSYFIPMVKTIVIKKTSVMDKNKARKEYPGAAIDKADNDRVSEKLVKESVKELNNNPRNSDEKMP